MTQSFTLWNSFIIWKLIITSFHLIIKWTRHRSALNVLALSSKQSQCMKVGSKLYYCCKWVGMTLNLPLIYFVWTEEYCQTSPNKNKSPNLWHVTSILVCCIFASRLYRKVPVDESNKGFSYNQPINQL